MARIEVAMPQMGESIAEGTVSRWLKRVGDEVSRDEPIVEISTDKVDAEIPSPAAGTLVEILVQEGTTVDVGTPLAFIETEKAAAAEAAPPKEAAPAGAAEPAAGAAGPAPAEAPEGAAQPEPAERVAPGGDGRVETEEERLRRRSSPVVRRIAAEHAVDLAEVPGTGQAGRVTKQDILSFIKAREEAPAPAPATRAPAARPAGEERGPMSADRFWEAFFTEVRHPEYPAREGDRVEPMNRMRRLTAAHMVLAKRIAPHVHSIIEVDFTALDRARAKNRDAWAAQGVKVSYTALVAWAVARALREFPVVNATISGDDIIYRGAINLGIAVDLNPGLIVPVVRNADELTVVGIAKRISDLAARARNRQLKPDEVQGATFSITNPGVLGTLVGMPIIPAGTAAILGTGAVQKKPVVFEVDGTDVIAIRKRALFSLGYDHRIIDGADAARFLTRLQEILETIPEDVA